ncbi:bifunctional UDP-N-acetylglucosamine diphosphorylase/glucosamine-1-phosphate N-acetyltransferase GlmU [Parvularcula sp. IMCC14364]|uniref:bifunctional UDP-N-acetylglucosamine diphosphorylase/glucosamine-1-phosphate N-acetyltransferase GlmU n=1 Tax=Parvularcula sp. IMCC14364 TaxID=3067902 RepID=UPI0027424D36|nr:bifunctional UDP-N-acetylglucosamine diphosphorylase/glucosamine-1-phosphate N-acetyltransferase GlmU [Parvularcula sp. IMCC14364]
MSKTVKTAIVILAAGHGTRMKSTLPKVLHLVGGLPMLGHVVRVAGALSAERLCVVIGDHAPEVGESARGFAPEAEVFVQAPPRGTGDAVTCAMPGLDGFEGVVFVLYADTPLIRPETLQEMARLVEDGAGVVVLGFRPEDPKLYGRLITTDGNALERIVEARDASPEELSVTLCNSGVMAMRAGVLASHLSKITNDNAKGEYYLTDIVELARRAGEGARVVECDEAEVMGVDSRLGLSEAEAVFQSRRREEAMLAGVTLYDPQTVYFSHDTMLAQDVRVGQNVVFGPGVRVESGAEIKAFSHLEGVTVKAQAAIGPFARLRPGTVVGEKAKIGNFVETKKAILDEGAKVSHLSYIGDAQIGAHANIGAGTITCNYDGFRKYQTVIGEGAFVGSNSSLVAPVTIGAGAYVGSGSVVTKDVEIDALAVARGRQMQKAGWALSFRQKMTSKEN